MDRFIPNRSAMDFDYANYALTQSWKTHVNGLSSSFGDSYRQLLALCLNQNHKSIMVYSDNKPKSPKSLELFDDELSSFPKTHPRLRRVSTRPERMLDAPGLLDNHYFNLLDWSKEDVLAVALSNSVFCLNILDGSDHELVNVSDQDGPVTSLSWSPNGTHLAVGLNNSEVQIWDLVSTRKTTTLTRSHDDSRVGSLAWNRDILTTGGKGGKIVNYDFRIKLSVVESYRGHNRDVCGLKWSDEGSLLASGGRDNVLCVWDKSMASSCLRMQCLHRIRHHKGAGAVRALAWSPHKRNLLASGGGKGDHCIKFWNSQLGQCLDSVDTGSEVCALLWNKYEKELLSSHGSTENQLALWKYPSMMEMATLKAHSSRVLYMAQSPNGCKVASAAGAEDETLRLWDIFPAPKSDWANGAISGLYSRTIR